jgi:8-oxo-dGTP pyrophosphatase MutT (NUDIX family)
MEIRTVKDRIECSGAIICAKDTSRILLLQKTEGKHAGRWVLPGGTVVEGETAFQGLQRELQEDIGGLPNFINIIPL